MGAGAGQTAVLAVADDGDVEALSAWLAADGMATRAAMDVDTALSLAKETRPALLVLDADLDCPTFVDAVKGAGGLLADGGRIVVIGGEADPAWMVVCVAAGADAFLVKPLRREAWQELFQE